MSILSLDNVSYFYDGTKKNVLENISYDFDPGLIYAVVGRSGAGKTTLLSLLSGLTNPKKGSILWNEKDINKLNKYTYRSQYIGVIFQSFNLLPNLTAVENVILSMDISGKKFNNKKQHALELLGKVGLSEDEAHRRVLKLSGGQQQRVAIARALSYDPEIILADEPTGNLDLETQDDILDIFSKLAKEENKCIVLVTHSPQVSERADKIYELIPLKGTRPKSDQQSNEKIG
ncbi:MAG: ABC transporter ATP-binding protein [Bacillota bacterium]|nr:ABC transporter ATP-binding protein [Bacillota bacterium]